MAGETGGAVTMTRIAIKDERELDAPKRQASAALEVSTRGAGLVDITAAIEAWLEKQSFGDGLLSLFIRHTSASLTIQENADPDVRADLLDAFSALAPESTPWRHASEGPDDMPAHVKAALTDTSLTVPIVEGRPVLGVWQAIYLFEHRRHGHIRSVHMHYLGT